MSKFQDSVRSSKEIEMANRNFELTFEFEMFRSCKHYSIRIDKRCQKRFNMLKL